MWLRFGLAASVFLVLGLGAAGYVGLITGALGPGSSMMVVEAPAVEKSLPATKQASGVASRDRGRQIPRGEAADAGITKTSLADSAEAGSQRIAQAATALVGRTEVFGSWLNETIEEHRRSVATLGAAGHFDHLPPLDALEMPAARGMTPPLVHGYDLLFHLKHGDHPFVAPAAHKQLASTAVPLFFGTSSYDLALRGLAGGSVPAAEEIHVEDFLAAQHYALRTPQPGEVALHVAAAPSPLDEPGLYMMQVAVQSGPNRASAHVPARLLVLLDTSSAMLAEGRWEMALRSLDKIADQMAPTDRVTLLGFAEQPQMLVDNATADQLRGLVTSGKLPAPIGSANLPAAIQSAVELAPTLPMAQSCRVVFVTAGRHEWNETTLAAAGSQLAELSAVKIPWQVVRLTPGAGLAVGGGDPGEWTTLAERGRGDVSTAATAADIHRVLVKKLIGRSSTVAKQARLKVIFNPRIVTGYRLLGHASQTLTGSADDVLEVELDADELATGLFEMWVKPDGGDEIAAAELTWKEPSSGQQRRQVQVLKRRQIASSFAKAPAWMQHGVIAAKTAESLRGSFFTSAAHPVAQLQAAASQVDERVAEQPDFQALLELLRHVEKRH